MVPLEIPAGKNTTLFRPVQYQLIAMPHTQRSEYKSNPDGQEEAVYGIRRHELPSQAYVQ